MSGDFMSSRDGKVVDKDASTSKLERIQRLPLQTISNSETVSRALAGLIQYFSWVDLGKFQHRQTARRQRN